MGNETPRRHVEVTVTVAIDGTPQVFTADATTTGRVENAARQLVNAVTEDAKGWLHDRQDVL